MSSRPSQHACPDAALYFAKHHGRNNARQYEKLVESGELTRKENEGEIEMF